MLLSAVQDGGCGATAVVDIGAYERPGQPAEYVQFADLNGDGAINASDLFMLFSDWPCNVLQHVAWAI